MVDVPTQPTSLFDSMDQSPNLFSGMSNPEELGPKQTPAYVNNQATVATLANAKAQDVNSPDALSMLSQAADTYRQAIKSGQELEIRKNAAAEQQQDELRGIIGIGAETRSAVDPGIAMNISGAAQAVMAQDQDTRAKYALEQKAIERVQDLAAQGDYTQAQIVSNNIIHGGAEDVIRDMNTKRLILNREIDQAQMDESHKGWFSGLADFALSMIPLRNSLSMQGNVNNPDVAKHWYDWLAGGQRIQSEADSLWAMPVDQFSDYVKNHLIPTLDQRSTLLGYKDKSQHLDLLTQLGAHTNPVLMNNAQNLVDNLGLLPFTKLGKVAVSLPMLLVKNGARKELGSLVAAAADSIMKEGIDGAATKTGLSEAEVKQNLSVSAINVDGPASTIPVTGDAVTALERGKALLQGITNGGLIQPGRLLPEEQQAVLDSFVKKTTEEFKNDVQDVDLGPKGTGQEQKLADGSTTKFAEFTLGKRTGGLYQSEATATRAAKSLGYPDAEIIRDESGGYGIKITRDISEAGFYTNLNVQAKSSLARRLLNARITGDAFMADVLQVSGNTRNALIKALDSTYSNSFRALKHDEREALGQVMAAGENQGVWYTHDQFQGIYDRGVGRPASENEWRAYNAGRDINDIEYALRNDVQYKEKVLKGFQTLKVEYPNFNFRGNALINRNMGAVPRERVYNLTDGIHYTKGNQLTPEKLAKLKEDGYILVSTEDAQTLHDGTRIKNFLVKSKDAEISPLNRYQLDYRAGGHRFYEGKYFGKQAVMGVQPDTLEKYLDNPNTYINGETKAEVDAWTQRMEAGRLAYKEGLSLPEIEEALGGSKGLPTAEEFVAGMKDGTYQANTPFRTMYDREALPEYVGVDEHVINYHDPDESGFNGWLRTNGRMYYSKKGTNLPDWRGEMAPTLDAFKSINRSIMNVANLSSFSDFKISSIERWVNKFGKYLEGRAPGQSDYSQFSKLALRADTETPIREAAITQKQIIQRNIGWKTDFDREMEQYQRSIVEWIGGHQPGSWRNEAAKMTNWVLEKNPVQKLRGYAFDAKLGMFNPGQLIVQAGTMYASLTLSPKFGLQAISAAPLLRAYLTKSGGENMLDYITKLGAHGMMGMEEAEFKQYARYLKKSGFFDFGGSHSLIHDYGAHAALSGVKDAEVRIREAGRFFFNEAEMWNRMTASGIAWKETAEKFPQLAKDSDEFIRRVAGRSEDYAFSMSSTSQAWWQKGLLSIPTQFWAYNARTIEAMLGPQFTAVQKMRLALGQFMLFGSAGLPVLPFVMEKIKQSGGDPSQFGFDTPVGMADHGLLDVVMHNMFGTDNNFGKRYGVGNWPMDAVSDIFGWGQYGDKTTADVLGGATYAILGQFGGGLVDTVRYVVAESGSEEKPLTREALLKMASNVSSVSNFLKAAMVMQYHTYETGNGTTLSNDVPTADAVGIALGFQPGTQENVSIMMGWQKNRTKVVDEAVKVLQNYRARFANEPDKQEEISQQVNAFTRLLPPAIRADVLARANRSMSPTLEGSLAMRIKQKRVESDTATEYNNGQ
jgi:hypothetical protein